MPLSFKFQTCLSPPLTCLSGKSLLPWQTCTKWPICPSPAPTLGDCSRRTVNSLSLNRNQATVFLQTCSEFGNLHVGHPIQTVYTAYMFSQEQAGFLYLAIVDNSEVLSKHAFQTPCKTAWKQFNSAHPRAKCSGRREQVAQWGKTISANYIVYLGITGEMSLVILWSCENEEFFY